MPVIFIQNSKTRVVWLLCGALVLISVTLLVVVLGRTQHARQPALYFLNVGQGDSLFIELPGGVQVLIDGGPDGRKLLTELSHILPPQDRYIDLVIMTHPQLDHFGGFVGLLSAYRIGAFIGTQRKANIAAYAALSERLKENSIPYLQLLAGDRIRIGDAQLVVLSPSPTQVLDKELNDTSLVVQLQSKEIKALYTGDIGGTLEEKLAQRYDVRSDVFKVSHHGSRFSSNAAFLREVAPAIAVIGVGKNSYGHPTNAALQRLRDAGAQIFRTDEQGSIKIIRAGDRLDVFRAF